jgi:predicted alpha-1,2-mannosidase
MLFTRIAAAAVLLSFPLPAQFRPVYPHVDYVEPRIDTKKPRWIFFASASRPFGLVNLSPDTNVEGDWGAGYVYGEPYVRCFSHVHGWQIAAVPVMPIVASPNPSGPPSPVPDGAGPIANRDGSRLFDPTFAAPASLNYEAYKSRFSHSTEVVKPGYHKLLLDRYGITAELTSTKRVGFHRYTFPATNDAYVLFDVGAPIGMTKVQDAAIRRVNARELAGHSLLAPTQRRSRPLDVFFVVQFDRDMSEFGGWNKSGYARFRFAKPGPLLMKVALSYVSEAGARNNLKGELPRWDFDQAVRDSYAEWNQWLGKIAVEGGTREQRVKFYTDLWHALLGRGAFSDLDGSYIDNTGDAPRVRHVPVDADGKARRDTFNSDAFWGSQWNLNILWSMAYPRLMSEQVASLVDYYRNGGMIARGPAGGNYTFVMIGDQATPLIAAAYNKGIRDFDVQAAYEGCVKNAYPGGIRDRAGYETGPDPKGGGMPYYVDRGYVPLGAGGKGMHREGAAQTLEYAYQDWCLSQFARALGRTEDAEKFEKRSGTWRTLFDPSTGWIRPRNMDGSWLEPFSPTCDAGNCRGFVESNSAIYTYFVPQDIRGLIDALGGNSKFIEKLTKQFDLAAPARFITPHGRHGENWIDYENQPSCDMAHLFSHAGAPWLTQYWVRRIKQEVFGDTSPYGGYNGDEDQGQMGGLGALMAIGLFDIQGGASVEPRYEITSPLFDRTVIQLDRRYYPGSTFTILTRDNRPGNVYIQSAKLNGKPIEGRFWITHREFAAGGVLEIELGPEPNKNWGVVK